MPVTYRRQFIWLVIVVALLRGLWAFDSGPSADTHETTAAAVLFGAALISATLMHVGERLGGPPGGG
jgi:hypothetical protein